MLHIASNLCNNVPNHVDPFTEILSWVKMTRASHLDITNLEPVETCKSPVALPEHRLDNFSIGGNLEENGDCNDRKVSKHKPFTL